MTELYVFGRTADGETVHAAKLKNACGMCLTVLEYGAAVQSLLVPNAAGGFTDVVLGYDTAEEYAKNDSYLGAVIGRFANRIGGASFSLGGKEYRLAKNDGENSLHGGNRGFDKRMWSLSCEANAIVCTRLSPDGEENYPGNLEVRVRYALDEENTLTIGYDAVSDADTVVNLTNHSYFNLDGGGTVLGHGLTIPAERFLENDGGCLPTGRILNVAGTPFDFREEKEIGRDIGEDHIQILNGKGYDHNFVLSGETAAVLYGAESGICMRVSTDLPGVQFYTSNCLTPRKGKGGAQYGKYSGVCLETQMFPNALRCRDFPSPILHAGEHLHSETRFAFSIR